MQDLLRKCDESTVIIAVYPGAKGTFVSRAFVEHVSNRVVWLLNPIQLAGATHEVCQCCNRARAAGYTAMIFQAKLMMMPMTRIF